MRGSARSDLGMMACFAGIDPSPDLCQNRPTSQRPAQLICVRGLATYGSEARALIRFDRRRGLVWLVGSDCWLTPMMMMMLIARTHHDA